MSVCHTYIYIYISCGVRSNSEDEEELTKRKLRRMGREGGLSENPFGVRW